MDSEGGNPVQSAEAMGIESVRQHNKESAMKIAEGCMISQFEERSMAFNQAFQHDIRGDMSILASLDCRLMLSEENEEKQGHETREKG